MDYFDLKIISQGSKKFTDVTKDIFDYLRVYHHLLGRISVVVLENNELSTYHSEDINDSLGCHLEFKASHLKPHTSLWEIIQNQTYRVIDDMNTIKKTPQIVQLINAGYVSSMTVPIVYRDNVAGMIFFNAKSAGYFSEENIVQDFIYTAQVLSSRYIEEVEKRSHFKKLLQVALKISHHRDPETSQHLIRMGKYSELLARLLAQESSEITTEFIHRIRFYAPFHDIGKYRIPDEILFSNKVFSPKEREVMNKHPIFGEEIIDEVLRISDLNSPLIEEMRFLKNIIRFHHEAYDGSGYPDGLKQTNIPIEARIVTVADVFDALLSKRPYKEPWSIGKVMWFIKDQAGTLFDPLCTKVLVDNIEQFLSIRALICDSHTEKIDRQAQLIDCH